MSNSFLPQINVEECTMKEKFIKALETNNLAEMRKIPKSDLHNHSPRGGNKRYIENWAGVNIPTPPKFKDLNHMNTWNLQNIKPLLIGTLGYEKRIEAAFVQAKMDGVKVLHMSFSIGEEIWYDNSAENMVQALKRIHQSFAPEVIFIPEIGLNSYTPIDELNEKLNQFLSQNYFKPLICMEMNLFFQLLKKYLE